MTRFSELAHSGEETVPHGARIGRETLSSVPSDDLRRVLVRVEFTVWGIPGIGAVVPSVDVVNASTGETTAVIGDVRSEISAEARR